MKPSVYCVIPARYGSTRLPAKPLADINGLPLVMWVYNGAKAAGVFDKIIVATDHEAIKQVVEQHGGHAVMTSPDHRRGSERVYEAISKDPCDFVVNLQGDEPDIPAGVLTRFVTVLRTLDDNSLLTIASHATITDAESPHVVKVVLAASGDALYFSRSCIPYDRDPTGEKRVFLKHKGIYGFTSGGLARYCAFPEGVLERRESLEQLRALEHGMKIRCLIDDFESSGIDTPEDLARFRNRMQQ